MARYRRVVLHLDNASLTGVALAHDALNSAALLFTGHVHVADLAWLRAIER